MQATVAQLPYLMGRTALIETKKYLGMTTKAGKFSKYVPTIVVDKKKLEKSEEPLLAYLR